MARAALAPHLAPLALTFVVAACQAHAPAAAAPAPRPGAGALVLLASTIGPIDAGLVPALEEAFERDTGIRVRHVGAGTGEALKIAERGGIDLVLVHARALEEKFVQAGYGTERIPLMYNDFVLVGPPGDPAGAGRAGSIAAALQAIAATGSPFLTRGDKSGTHVAELDLWAKAGVKPGGAWYLTFARGSEGNAPTLRHAGETGTYTIIDRATWLAAGKGLPLAILCEKDPALLNLISLIPVSPARFPAADHAAAMAFVRWLTDPARGQRLIERFGVTEYGAPMFFPDSREWRAGHGG